MKYKVIEKNNVKIAIIEDDVLITDEQTAIDTFMTISYEAEADRFIISEKNLKSLKAFIYECNCGKDIFFTGSIDEAVTMLGKE